VSSNAADYLFGGKAKYSVRPSRGRRPWHQSCRHTDP